MGGALSLAFLVVGFEIGYVARRGVDGRAAHHRLVEMGILSEVGRARVGGIVNARMGS
jgi:hypothetical protein